MLENILYIIMGNSKYYEPVKLLLSDCLETTNKPSEYVETHWKKWEEYTKEKEKEEEKKGENYNSQNGKVFECILATLLVREGIAPFYYQAKMAFIPETTYDFILYRQKKSDSDHSVTLYEPICLSTKTSLRERHKQAELESIHLKNVYRHAETYIITRESPETIKKKNQNINNKKITSIDGFLTTKSEEFNILIKRLKDIKNELIQAEQVEIINPKKIIQK